LPKDISSLLEGNWDCINELSKAAYRVLKETICRSAKQQLNSGMILATHTYGDEMNWNVHFHTIIPEGGKTAKSKEFKSVYYLPYEIMRKKWKEYSLSVISRYVPMTKENQMILDYAYNQYVNGFNIKRIKGNIPKKELVGYIARYIRHPPISNRRIVDYKDNNVTIICKKADTKIKYKINISVDKFITRLIKHIPPKNYKLIHYFGLYSRVTYTSFIRRDKQETIIKYFGGKPIIKCLKCMKILYPVGFFYPFYPEKPPPKKVWEYC
jgi:hypothetical protein